MKGLIFLGMLLFCASLGHAQEEMTIAGPSEEMLLRLDSLRMVTGLTDDAFAPQSLLHLYELEHFTGADKGGPNVHANFWKLPRKSLYEPMILQWHNGGLTGGNYEEDLKGLMAVRSANLLAVQRIGNVTISGGASATRMAWYQGVHTSYTLQGAVDWQINERFSFHAFGRWVPGGMGWFYGSHTTTPGMVGLMPYTNFGATFGVAFNEHWGMDVGAQVYRAAGPRSKYQVVPIVAPYYKFNSGAKISIDVGGILYELLRSKMGWNPGNPSVVPSGAFPPITVDPRR